MASGTSRVRCRRIDARLDDLIEPTSFGPATTELPDEVYRTLREVIDALLKGKAITIAPHDTMLTTQQAADMLGISRPTLVKLLERDEIPYEKPGRHRRVRLADLVAYRDQSRVQRRQALRDLTQEADDDGLYDTGTGFVTTR